MSCTAEPGELVTTAGVAPLVPLRVGMRYDDWAAFDGLPNRAVVLDANESPWTGEECTLPRLWEEGDERLFPMHLIYIPRDWEGPVEAPELDAGGTESAGGQVVAGTGTPTQEGYRQMMRQKSMAAHPAGKGMAIGDSRAIFDGGDALGPELDLLAYYPADRGRV